MPANLTQKKSDAVSKLIALATPAFVIAAQVSELQAFLTDNGFLTGGANAIVDADFVGTNAHLDAASFNAAVGALSTITLSNANKTLLRKASNVPVPGS